MKSRAQSTLAPGRSLGAAALVGIGVMAGIDEIIFHQLLQWHHFFDWSTPTVGIISDGILHAVELIAIVAGFALLLDLRRAGTLATHWAWAGFFIGMGGFQLFDGIVNHKVLGIHQIRYDVNILPYDIVWNLSALILLGIGLWLWRRAKARDRAAATATGS